MSFERFEKAKHVPLIVEWYRARDMLSFDGNVDESLFAETGFIVDGILASFLYTTNSTLAYIDNTVADPQSTKEDRWKAMQEMLPLLVEEAKALGVKALCTLAYHKSFDKLLNEGGFSALPDEYTVYLRRL